MTGTVTMTPTANIPNPSCCNFEGYLCPKCEAVAEQGSRPAFFGANNAVFDPTDILPLPAIDYADKQEQPREFVRNGAMADGGDPSMIPPTINWNSEANENRRTITTNSVDCDYLPLPKMTF